MTAIRVELELKDGSFVSGMLRAGQSLDSFKNELRRLDPHFRNLTKNGDDVIRTFKRADDTSRTLLGTMRDVSIVMGAASLAFSALTGASGGVIGNIIKVNSEMERLRFQMEGLSDAADPVKDAADQVAYLREAATRAPFSIRELTSTFVKLKASGTDPLNGSMQALVDGIAAFGGTDEQLHRVTLGITQMTGKGVIQMEEMRQQLGESMPTAMRLMARSMGVSVAELIDAISTGRVEAKSALAGFYEELNRAYGGEAQRMMGTFSGQVTQMTANLQNLSTTGGLFEFFENLKTKLQEFNDFLKSPEARSAADQFGRGLSYIADVVTSVAKTLYAFRGELKALAMAIAGFVALKTLASGFKAIGLSVNMMRGEVRAGINTMQAASTAAATANIALGSASTGAARAGVAFASMGSMIGGGLRVAGAAVPWLGLVASIAMFAADKFGLLSDKTDEAYQNLVRYGAESRAQAEEALAAKEAELRANLESAQNPSGFWAYAGDMDYAGYIETTKRELKEAQEALDKFLAEKQGYIERAATREGEIEIEKQDRLLDIAQSKMNAEYDRNQTLLDNRYQAERDAAAKNGEDVSAIEEKYQAETLKNRQELIKKHIKLHDDELNKVSAMYLSAIGNQDRAEEARLGVWMDNIYKRRVALFQELNAISDTVFGTTMIEPVVDNEELRKKGEKALEDLRESIKGLEADIGGASGEYAKMLYRIERGDFGSVEQGSDAFQQLTKDILEATRQKEALDSIMDGRKDITGDIERLRDKLREEQLKLDARKAGRVLTEGELIKERLNAGLYEGLGPIENIRNAIQNLASVTEAQGLVAEQAGKVMRENTFGQVLLNQIDKIRLAIMGVTGEINNMGVAAGSMNFGGMTGGFANVVSNVDGGILDLIASRESGGDYNATLDNGRWTNGAQNLTAMTLNQVRELQKFMLSNPENRRLYGDGKGSSALGRYQIVGQTLEGLMREMGLTGNELYDEAMQDRMGAQLVARRGGNPAALRQEWAGLNGVSDEQILAALQKSQTGPTVFAANMKGAVTAPVTQNTSIPALPVMDTSIRERMEKEQRAFTEKMRAEADALIELEKAQRGESYNQDRIDYLRDLKESVLDANKPLEDLGKNYSKVIGDIRAGKLGDNKNIDAEEYKEILLWAKKVDEAELKRDQRKSARTDAENQKAALDEKRLELEKDIADTQARIKNPDYKGQSDDIQKLTASLDEYVESVKTAYGEQSQAYKDAKAYRDQMIASGMTLEGAKLKADLTAQTRDLQDSLLTQDQLIRVQLDRDLEAIDMKADAMRAAGMSEVEITEYVEAAKAAIRAKYNKDVMTPFQQQMEEWGKLSENLKGSTGKWMDSMASGIAGLITGTGDLQSAINGIINDIVNMGVRYAISSFMPEGKGGTGGGAKGTAKSAATSKGTSAATKMPVGVKHTGGIVGAGGGMARMVSGSVFSHAKKYHTGGLVGGPRLMAGEVPIIAKKGEGVFTPEQMSAMGSFASANQYQINAPITVNGSAGTPAQNDDLAKKMAKELDGTMRLVVQDEFRKQSRPGNMMNSRNK